MTNMLTPEDFLVRALTNEALAARLSMVRNNRRAFAKKETDRLLEEAERRLRWPDAYQNHNSKADVPCIQCGSKDDVLGNGFCRTCWGTPESEAFERGGILVLDEPPTTT